MTTQQTIATLRENNAQLEVAVQTATESVNTLQADIKKMSELNSSCKLACKKQSSMVTS